ncbi:MAG: hypothetical protein ACRD0D_04390 [Acidimicrobiales bacterium]
MPTHPFLSPAWIEAARQIGEEYRDRAHPDASGIRLNQVITGVPFGEGRIEAHVDNSAGVIDVDLGHLLDPHATITLDYRTAEAVFVEGNPQMAVQEFMAGNIRIDGDLARVVEFVSQGEDDPMRREIQQRLQAITLPAGGGAGG